ncbi:enoyl-CoA hydratase-related protein [Haloplasma contractile]|uniref:3-hydroxybutyryl-CoA dehydratase protein n=1 Tax=Haloplasma contractile SSD-17B TaxID=1033810 RepID=F7PW15_9MOLU|nr:enoyl-CoA hydratase-related protein [Haloplasma contractile]ERJ12662.1 3-hydroxybutyryl-CoA dehydratase protein [Haloplasma contractile SSD-17B]
MEYKNLVFEITDQIATITFNREEAYNALNRALLRELDDAVSEIEKMNSVSVIIFKGKGNAFVAGADISEMANMCSTEAKAYGEYGARIFRRIEMMDQVTIASINGFCLGGGNELAMACDLRLASSCAKFGQPEVTLGITPGFSGTKRLPRLVGLTKAKELLYTGGIITANEAYEIGLVNYVIAPERLEEETMKLTIKILNNSKNAIQYVKRSVDEGVEIPIEEALVVENNYFSKCFDHEDQKDRMNAFLNKNKK